MHILIDNYDSFTYNLYQYLIQIGGEKIKVIRNDKISLEDVLEMNPQSIIISPGPGRPENAGIIVKLIKHFGGKVPILGVCLGHQAIAYAFGALIVPAKQIIHGKTDLIYNDGCGLFRNIPSPCLFTRYHSLAVDEKTIPSELEVTSKSGDGEIMGIRHKYHIIEGIQFHPESVASEYGKKLLKNFLNYRRKPFSIPLYITELLKGKNLSFQEAEVFMEQLTEGELTEAQIAGFLTALRSKEITCDEIAGFASVLKKRKKRVSSSLPLLDTCGTGGDGKGSFNISSLAALVASACGARVAKHGNRGISSRSGSADFFSHLGIPIDLEPEQASELLSRCGFTFLFAPLYHESMKHAAKVRRELGIKTVMNLLGPLVNPAEADHQLIGVYDQKLCVPMAQAAVKLGVTRVMVVHSEDGFDEISVCAPTRIVEMDNHSGLREYTFYSEKTGIPLFSQNELSGDSAQENARRSLEIIENPEGCALTEAVLLNAGAGLYVYGVCSSIEEGYHLAKEALKQGKVKEKMQEVRRESEKIKMNKSGSKSHA